MSQEPQNNDINENLKNDASLFYKINIKQFYNIDTITERLLSYPHYKDINELSASLERQLKLINQQSDKQQSEGSSLNVNNDQFKFQTLRSIVNETLNDIFRTNDIIHKIDYYKFKKIVQYIIRKVYDKQAHSDSSTTPSDSSTSSATSPESALVSS